MVKKAARKRPTTRPNNAELARVNAQRAEARRVLAAQQNLRDLTRRIARASSGAKDAAIGTARLLAAQQGYVLLDEHLAASRADRLDELTRENSQLRAELEELREQVHAGTV
jgi:ABC-type proline/glycine betaine transport system ATPase subunit